MQVNDEDKSMTVASKIAFPMACSMEPLINDVFEEELGMDVANMLFIVLAVFSCEEDDCGVAIGELASNNIFCSQLCITNNQVSGHMVTNKMNVENPNWQTPLASSMFPLTALICLAKNSLDTAPAFVLTTALFDCQQAF